MNQYLRQLVLVILVSLLLPQRSQAQNGNDNPTGVAGEYNGSITTGGSYDPYTGNASRVVQDIVVAGSVGAYPLKWTRTLNTRGMPASGIGQAGGWSHCYDWHLSIINRVQPTPTPCCSPGPDGPDATLHYPDGREVGIYEPWKPEGVPTAANGPFGVYDRLIDRGQENRYDLLLGDGGVVKFHSGPYWTGSQIRYSPFAYEIVDPYGQTTLLARDETGGVGTGRLLTITEPAGRYLQINYGPHGISTVQAFDRLGGQVTQTVTYHYTPITFLSGSPPMYYLTQVDYNVGPPATYEYQSNNMPNNPYGLIKKCHDVRYAGAMSHIKYEYMPGLGVSGIASGQIKRELNVSGQILSEVIYPAYGDFTHMWHRTELRPDGATREFEYWLAAAYIAWFTDFEQHTSRNDLTPFWEFTDAREKTTVTEREAVIGAVKKVTHPGDGSTIKYEYSDSNNPHYLVSKTDERDKTTTYTRDPDKRITQVDYPDGGQETFTYDLNPFGLVNEHRMTSGGVEDFRYDDRGLKTLSWPPATPSDPSPSTNPTRYCYYDATTSAGHFHLIDRLRYVEDPLGHKTFYDYNPRGQVTSIIHDDGTFVQNDYNDDGTLNWTEDELAHRTSYLYDEYKRVTAVKNHLQQPVTNSYAPDGLSALSHTTSSVYLTTSPTAKEIKYDYDHNFRRKEMKQAPNTPDQTITTYHYDPVGNLDWVEDPRTYRTNFGYDDRNRQVTITNSNTPPETTTVGYDPASNKVKETRHDTTVRMWTYDSMNRLWQAIDWREVTGPSVPVPHTTYDRDFAGNVHTITDPKGAVYTYDYDKLNRKISATYPVDAYNTSRTETWLYDVAGNLDQYKNPAEQLRHFHYDNRNRQDHSWWDGDVGPNIVTRYDDASRVTRVLCTSAQMGLTGGMAPDEISAETTVTFGYDDANRKMWEEQKLIDHPTRHIQTDLNDDGTRHNLRIMDPQAGFEADYYWPQMQDTSYLVTYDYTARNQLKSIQGEDWAFNYIYDPSGNMTTREAVYNGSNGPVVSATNCPTGNYDPVNRPTTWEHTSSGVQIGGRFAFSHYQYDNVNREIATWRDQNNGLGERFTYEPTNQLASVAYDAQTPARTVSYDYTLDKLNRSSVTDNGQITNYSPNLLNQYGSVGGTSYSYDANFNLTGTGALNATYDAANHLVSAIHGNDNVQFVYDGLGRCVKRTIGGYAAVFAYDGWKPIAEWDEWNGCQAWNVYGPGADEILLRHQNKYGYIRFQLDRHGNVAFLLDNDGNGLEKYTYDVFGRPRITDWYGNEHQYSYYGHRSLFQGRDYIHELGIYDYRNRFYHPGLGRFLQTDPKGFDAGDMNLFRYCGDDPVDGSDPLGLEDIFISGLWNNLGILASMNSRAATIAARDGLGRSQLIVDRGGHLSLQRNADGSNKINKAKEYEGKKWHGSIYRNEKVQVEASDAVGKGEKTAGKGHVHDDSRHGFKSGDWSSFDHITANGVAASRDHPAIMGKPVWKALTSNGRIVARLTPQTVPGKTATEIIFAVGGDTAAQEIEPAKHLSPDSDGPPSGGSASIVYGPSHVPNTP